MPSNTVPRVTPTYLRIMVTLAVVISCSCRQQTDQQQLKLAQIPITYSAVTYLAGERGYVKQEELALQVISVPAGPDVVTALKGTGENSADAGGIAITPVITMIAAGAEPVVIATTLESSRQAKLVTFSVKGIDGRPATLRGKRIGVTKNTNGDIYLSRLLRKGGLVASDVTLVNGRPADLRGLLLRDEIDAAVLWDPFVVQAVREYRQRVGPREGWRRGQPAVLVDPSLHTLAFNIVTTRAKLERKRPELLKLLRASIAAEKFIAENRQEAQAALEKWLGLQEGDLNDFFRTTEFHVHADAPQLSQWMQEELRWLKEAHPEVNVPADYRRFIDTSLLSEVAMDRVRN